MKLQLVAATARSQCQRQPALSYLRHYAAYRRLLQGTAGSWVGDAERQADLLPLWEHKMDDLRLRMATLITL
jgi:hypothetical protein